MKMRKAVLHQSRRAARSKALLERYKKTRLQPIVLCTCNVLTHSDNDVIKKTRQVIRLKEDNPTKITQKLAQREINELLTGNRLERVRFHQQLACKY